MDQHLSRGILHFCLGPGLAMLLDLLEEGFFLGSGLSVGHLSVGYGWMCLLRPIRVNMLWLK